MIFRDLPNDAAAAKENAPAPSRWVESGLGGTAVVPKPSVAIFKDDTTAQTQESQQQPQPMSMQ